MTPIRLIAFDIDGTLLDSRGRVPEANVRALAEAAARGVRLVAVTGRSVAFALPPLAALPDPLTLVAHNGAIARTRAGQTLVRRLLPRGAARAVIEATRAWRHHTLLHFDRPGAGQVVYDRLDWDHPQRRRFHEKNRALMVAVPALEQALDEDPIQVSFNGSVALMHEVLAHVESLDCARELAVALTEYPARDFSLVDVCAAGATKGQTLARVAEAAGVARAEVLAVGDNFNDREMLAWAGTGVVMGNADPALRAGPWPVTRTNDEAGLAEAVARWVLGGAGG